MSRRTANLFSLSVALLVAWRASAGTPTTDEIAEVLRRQTQELIDAVATGEVAVWERYLHEAAVITAEDGAVVTKAEMVKELRPLPEGVTGTIQVTEFEARVQGAVAVTTYVDDEHEPRYRKVFRRGPDGRITGFAERREAWDLDWTRVP